MQNLLLYIEVVVNTFFLVALAKRKFTRRFIYTSLLMPTPPLKQKAECLGLLVRLLTKAQHQPIASNNLANFVSGNPLTLKVLTS